jgi:hypothetical protein
VKLSSSNEGEHETLCLALSVTAGYPLLELLITLLLLRRIALRRWRSGADREIIANLLADMARKHL